MEGTTAAITQTPLNQPRLQLLLAIVKAILFFIVVLRGLWEEQQHWEPDGPGERHGGGGIPTVLPQRRGSITGGSIEGPRIPFHSVGPRARPPVAQAPAHLVGELDSPSGRRTDNSIRGGVGGALSSDSGFAPF